MAEQHQQDPHAVADPAFPFGREPARLVCKSHTDKIMRIFNNPARVNVATDEQTYNRLIHTQPTAPEYVQNFMTALTMYNNPKWDEEYHIMYELFIGAILNGAEAVTLGGTSPTDPAVDFTLEEMVLLCSTRSPVPQSGHLLFLLLERGYTHVALLKTGSRGVGEVSLAAHCRHLMRSIRVKKPYGIYGHPQMPVDGRTDVYPHLIQLLLYLPVPVSEATLSIECLMEDLREHAANPEKAEVHESGEERGRPVHPDFHWRLQRGMRGYVWGTICGLMASPPTEEQPTREGDEADRPDSVEDPETGYFVNKGDAFVKSVELSQSEKECANSRAANGLHAKEFSTLGFPQVYTPSLKGLSSVMTIAACVGIIGGIVGMRVWANSFLRKPSSQ